jgi:hypothetical protein
MVVRLLFERAWLLLMALTVLQLLLIVMWSWWRTKRSAHLVWIGFAAMALLPTVSHLVVTPRERITSLCRTLARLVDAGDVAGIGSYLGADFETAGLDRDAFLDRVNQTLTRYDVDGAALSGFGITLTAAGRAVAEFNAVCAVRSADAYVARVLSRWRVNWHAEGKRWMVTHVEAVPTPLSPIRNVSDWLR